MIEIVFTIDYEIYGNGSGSLQEFVTEPTRRMFSIFKKWDASFVVFAEGVEFRKIEEFKSDDGAGEVREQLRMFREAGVEIALHLHGWWYEAQYLNGHWLLGWKDRDICSLPEARIDGIVRYAIEYLRDALGDPKYLPLSYRGGSWIMQPTQTMAKVLAKYEVQLDSSVFKGGRMRSLRIDYRPASRNGWHWRFSDDVNIPDPSGFLLEVPIYTEMVPFWKMMGGKRLGLQRRVPVAVHGDPTPRSFLDYARLMYPRKLDFCRMSFEDQKGVMDRILREDAQTPDQLKVISSIGHSKDLVDFDSIDRFLAYLHEKGVRVTTFESCLPRLAGSMAAMGRGTGAKSR